MVSYSTRSHTLGIRQALVLSMFLQSRTRVFFGLVILENCVCVANGERVAQIEDFYETESCKNATVTGVDERLPKHVALPRVQWTARKLGAAVNDADSHALRSGIDISKLLTPIPAPSQPVLFADAIHEDVLTKWTPESLRKTLRGPFSLVAYSNQRTFQVIIDAHVTVCLPAYRRVVHLCKHV